MDVAIQAARVGCHILLEKPIADSMEQVPEFIEAVRAGGGQVLVGYHFRFHPGLQQARRLIEEEIIGHSVSARAHWGEYLPGWHPWEDYPSYAG
jgi:predicted dehydrogenase